MRTLLIAGGGGHAGVVASVAQRTGVWRIVGYTDTADRGVIAGLCWLGPDELALSLRQTGAAEAAALGVGHVGDPSKRIALFERLRGFGFDLPPIVDPSAVVGPDTVLGAATVIMPGAVVNIGTRVEFGCIINTHATIEHDCVIGAHSHIAPGATVCGGCHVGQSSMIGAGAVLAHGVRVPARCVVGAGATVVRDIQEPGVYVGTPARKLR
jgi:sugar O-acyltransferase (sialic acid O-acetyltransferase NeuD family)